MSVQTEIDRINQNINNAYAALLALGADMPEEMTSDNLAIAAGSAKVLLYIAQTLSNDQKAQARNNIGAEKSGAVSDHNTNANAHADIRKLIEELSENVKVTSNIVDGTLIVK